jgi:putative flippase GtrA
VNRELEETNIEESADVAGKEESGAAEGQEEVTARSFRQIFSSREYFVSTLKQFLKFGFVGILNTAISWILYYALKDSIGIYWANTVGFIAGVTNAYIWNVKWVFKGNRQGFKKTLPKFFFSYFVVSYLLGMFLIYLIVDLAGLAFMANWMPVINSAISMVVNFLTSKFWTFKK